MVSALVGWTSAFAVVLTGLQSVGASEAEAASGLLVVSVVMGVGSILFSWRTRLPVTLAWSTPGAALLAGAAAPGGGYAAAVGAFVVAALLYLLTAAVRPLGRLGPADPVLAGQRHARRRPAHAVRRAVPGVGRRPPGGRAGPAHLAGGALAGPSVRRPRGLRRRPGRDRRDRVARGSGRCRPGAAADVDHPARRPGRRGLARPAALPGHHDRPEHPGRRGDGLARLPGSAARGAVLRRRHRRRHGRARWLLHEPGGDLGRTDRRPGRAPGSVPALAGRHQQRRHRRSAWASRRPRSRPSRSPLRTACSRPWPDWRCSARSLRRRRPPWPTRDDREAAAVTFVVAASGYALGGVGAAFWSLVAGGLVLAVTRTRPALAD